MGNGQSDGVLINDEGYTRCGDVPLRLRDSVRSTELFLLATRQ
jgi:hypothetical protein